MPRLMRAMAVIKTSSEVQTKRTDSRGRIDTSDMLIRRTRIKPYE